MFEPLISVVINCYNGEKFIDKSIQSVLRQTYNKWELVFWDNASSDNSSKIYNTYKKSDKRLKYFRSAVHEKLYKARKRAIEKCRGEYFAFLDVDDWWKETKLETQIKTFLNKNVGLSCSNYWLVNERKNKLPIKMFNNKIPKGFVLSEVLQKNYIGMSTLIIRKKAYESLDYGFNENYEVIGDYDLAIRLLISWELAPIQDPLTYYRWHGVNLSITKKKLYNEELISWLEKVKKNKKIRNSSGYKFLVENIYYNEAIANILDNKRLKAFICLKKIKSIIFIFKIIILILLPINIIKYIRT